MSPLRHFVLLAAFIVLPTLAQAQLHWQPTERGIEGATIYALHETSTGAVLAETRIGLYRFDGADKRWTQVLDTQIASTWRFANGRVGAVHALGDGRHYLSTDDGRSWNVIESSGALVGICSDTEGGTIMIGEHGTSIDEGAS